MGWGYISWDGMAWKSRHQVKYSSTRVNYQHNHHNSQNSNQSRNIIPTIKISSSHTHPTTTLSATTSLSQPSMSSTAPTSTPASSVYAASTSSRKPLLGIFSHRKSRSL